MKHARLLALSAAAIAVTATTFVAAGTANADVVAASGVSWVNTAAQFTVTTDGTAPTDGWGLDTVDGTGAAALSFGPSGLSTDGSTGVAIEHTVSEPVGDLAALGASAKLVSSGQVQPILVVTPTNGDPITLEAEATGQAAFASDAEWFTFATVGTIQAGTPATLQELQAQFTATTPTATVSAYGAILSFPLNITLQNQTAPLLAPAANPGAAATVTAYGFDAATTYFTPTPTDPTVTPASLPVSKATTTGFTVSGTGFFPGETVTSGYGTGGGGNPLSTTAVADADGHVTMQLALPAGTTPGDTYSLALIGSTSGIDAIVPVTVTADPTPAAPVATPVAATASFTG